MSLTQVHEAAVPAGAHPALVRCLARFGDWLGRNRAGIRAVQWVVVGIYLTLILVPALLPLPGRAAHIWNDVTVFAAFAFWGLWWPFVLLSMVLVGRSWCGIFCPEGALTEFASRWSLNRAVPRWITWRGWPFTAFVCTTVYGQMVSVYQYPRPALLILGGSTAGAIVVGLLYGRNKRVWCRYLCPVNGVFAALAKLAPVSFQVDQTAWTASQRRGEHPGAVACAPLVPIRTMTGAADCHMCGRCSGFRGAVQLAPRVPGSEIVRTAGDRANPWETALILVGMMGVAVGAFHWSASPWFVAAKQAAAGRLLDAGLTWPLETTFPWFVFTNYPGQNDVMSALDGGLLLAYIGATALVLGAAHTLFLAAGVRAAGAFAWARLHHLAQSLIPVAGVGVFLGLSATTVALLRAEHVIIPHLAALRAGLLLGAACWSVALATRIGAGWSGWRGAVAAGTASGAAASLGAACWVLLFWVW